MFVYAGEEEHVIATQAMIAGHYVRCHGGIGMSYMRHIISVIYRRGNIKLTHPCSSSIGTLLASALLSRDTACRVSTFLSYLSSVSS